MLRRLSTVVVEKIIYEDAGENTADEAGITVEELALSVLAYV